MAKTVVPIELSSTPGIVDNSNATAITIDSSEDVTLAGHIVLADSKKCKIRGRYRFTTIPRWFSQLY